jgi:hypothetical protein
MSFGPWLTDDVLSELEVLMKPELKGATKSVAALGMLHVSSAVGCSDSGRLTRAIQYLEPATHGTIDSTHVLEALSAALAVVDRNELERLASALPSPSYELVRQLIRAAAQAEDWVCYEKHKETLYAMRIRLDSQTRCEILNFDGLAALAAGDREAVQSILAQLIVESVNVPYLDGPLTLSLVTRLIEEREFRSQCSAYLRQLQRNGATSRVVSELLQNAQE